VGLLKKGVFEDEVISSLGQISDPAAQNELLSILDAELAKRETAFATKRSDR